MKRFFALCLCGCLLLSGCTTPLQLNERAIVQAIGIDFTDGQYRLTVVYYSPVGASGDETAETTQENSKQVTAAGKTLTDAFDAIQLKTGKTNFYGHNNIVVLGRRAAAKKLGSVLTHLSGDLNLRANLEFLVAKGSANEILSAKLNDNIMPPVALYNSIRHAKQDGVIPSVRFIDVANAYLGEKRDVWIPLVSIESETAVKRDAYRLGGAAVYRKNRFVGLLTAEETLGVNLCTETLSNRRIALPDSAGSALHLTHLRTELGPVESEWRISVHCTAIPTDAAFGQTERGRDALAQAGERRLTELIRAGLSKALFSYRVNPITAGIPDALDVRVQLQIDRDGILAVERG